MRDPYDILGVKKTADAAEIKKAYRKLAKKHHPDANQGDPRAQERFSEATAAYDLLSDDAKRGQFDRGEIDAEGKPRFRAFGGRAPGAEGFSGFSGFSSAPGAGTRSYRFTSAAGGRRGFDMFSDLFSGLSGAAEDEMAPARGADISVPLKVSFVDAAAGATRRVTLPTGKALDVKIPAGIEDGKPIRLKGQGMPSPLGGEPGDAIVTVHVEPHPLFRVDGNDLRLDLPVTLYEAVLGAKVRVPTLEGAVQLTVPAGSSSGATLRLRGRGLPKSGGGRGDLLVSIRIVLPEGADADLEDLMRKRRDEHPQRVRGPEFED